MDGVAVNLCVTFVYSDVEGVVVGGPGPGEGEGGAGDAAI